MLKAILVVYILNTPGTQTFEITEMPSMAVCERVKVVMEAQTDNWTTSKKPIKNYYSADCVVTKEPNNGEVIKALKDQYSISPPLTQPTQPTQPSTYVPPGTVTKPKYGTTQSFWNI